jgi:hypothetical protein
MRRCADASAGRIARPRHVREAELEWLATWLHHPDPTRLAAARSDERSLCNSVGL